jgi:hypothetical protein
MDHVEPLPFQRRSPTGRWVAVRVPAPVRFPALVLVAWLAGLMAACSDPGVVGPDGGVPADAEVTPDALPQCQGDNDGVITAEELPMVAGLSVSYLVNAPGTTVTVNPGGYDDGQGGRSWDFSDEGGQAWSVSLQTVVGTWYESHFASAHYASPLAPGGDTLGVYRVADGAVWLLGYASPDPDRTLAVYDEPVPLIRFPVTRGMGWTKVSQITDATFDGQPFASTDTYRISVDQRGTVELPYLSLENTLRIQVELTTSLPGGQTVHRIQYLYLHECWGELARIVSTDGELDPNFTAAAEYRRLAL